MSALVPDHPSVPEAVTLPEHMPKVVGLCPDPSHTGEFYVPHGGDCPSDHYDHESVAMVEYVPASPGSGELREALEELTSRAQDFLDAGSGNEELREIVGRAEWALRTREVLESLVMWFGENDGRADDFGELNVVHRARAALAAIDSGEGLHLSREEAGEVMSVVFWAIDIRADAEPPERLIAIHDRLRRFLADSSENPDG